MNRDMDTVDSTVEEDPVDYTKYPIFVVYARDRGWKSFISVFGYWENNTRVTVFWVDGHTTQQSFVVKGQFYVLLFIIFYLKDGC